MEKLTSLPGAPQAEAPGFDLFRLSKSKQTVDVCPNTLREFNRAGLRFFRCGKAVFVSKGELAQFIRLRGSGPVMG